MLQNAKCGISSGSALLDKTKQSTGTEVHLILENLTFDPLVCQGFSYLSEVGARGILNLGIKAFGPFRLGKLDAV